MSTEVVEALLAEIQRLRETVALLRGTSCPSTAGKESHPVATTALRESA